MRILIIGAGKTGAFLAEKLHENHEITVIEQRPERAAMLGRMVPEANVLAGDACEPATLDLAGIADTDLVAAVTGDDEDNLVVAMLSKLNGVSSVYARVNHPRNEWLFDKEWGVDVPISSAQMAYGLIEKDLGFGDLVSLMKLNAQGVSIEEVTLPASATSVGSRLSEVELPLNVRVMAILAADGSAQVPHGETLLAAGDQLLLLVDGPLDQGVIHEALGVPPEVDGSETAEDREA